MKAMILAAGYGTRLFPLTIDRTKPAIPLLGKPLVGYVAEYLARFGIKDVIVNLHHQPESVKRALGDGSDFGVKIHYTLELPKILGTAGALDNAREHLEDDTFLIINGKIVTDIDISAAIEAHRSSGALATMVLKENSAREAFSEVYVEGSRITGFGDFPDPNGTGNAPLMFTGIHILEPRVFDYIPRGVYSDIVPTFYNPAIRKGELIGAHITDARWFELSTIPRYLEISLKLLNGSSERMIVGRNPKIAHDARLGDSVLWDNVTIEDGATVERSIIGDDVVVRSGEVMRDVAVVRKEIIESLGTIPEKALRGEVVGENYIVSLKQ
ncbi:MAG: NDP-sugar synthase [Acidobacteriota bacterium]|nr:MAG: NDP-sugar synthase [Acidobacteriota bacterium]